MNDFRACYLGPTGVGRFDSGALLIVWCWAYSVLPAAVSVLADGTASGAVSGANHDIITTGFWFQGIRFVCIAGLALSGIQIIMGGLANNRRFSWSALLPLMLVGTTIAVDILTHRSVSSMQMYGLLVATVCLFADCTEATIRSVALCTVLTAAISVGLGLEGGGLASNWTTGLDKSVLGITPLAGPFSHPNNLGCALALGLPFIISIRDNGCRMVSFLFVAFTLLLTASRISIFAAVMAVVIVPIITQPRGTPRFRRVCFVGAVIIAAMTPFIGFSDGFLTNRGWIWRVTREALASHWLFGVGDGAFHAGGDVTERLNGFAAFTAHNTILTQVARGGLLAGLLLVGLLLMASVIAASQSDRILQALTGSIISLVIICSAEGVSFDRFGGYAWGIILPLYFLLPQLDQRQSKPQIPSSLASSELDHIPLHNPVR